MKVQDYYFSDRNFLVENETFEEEFAFEREFYTRKPLIFKNCSFKNGIDLSKLKLGTFDIEFSDCDFGGENGIRCSDSKIERLTFINCSIVKIHLADSEIIDFLIEDCGIQRSIDLVDVKSSYTCLRNKKKDQITKVILVNSPELEEFEIDSASEIDTIKLFDFKKAEINCSIKELKVFEGDFKQLNLGLTSMDKSKNNSRIGKLDIGDIKQEGIIRIEDMYISELFLDRVDATNGTYFFNETVILNTHIESCIFSKFYCNQLIFINNPMIVKSDVSSFDLNNLGWENGKKLKGSEEFKTIPLFYRLRKKRLERQVRDFEADDIVELRDQKDTYRQFKKASLANKNNIDALQFHANEMQTYWKEVRITGNISIPDRILIFLDRWVSNFGQNWVLPLLWISIVTGVYYFMVDRPKLSYYPSDWLNGFLEALYYVNPVRKIDAEAARVTQGLDVLFRIFNAYFIYHFIKASRKFGKV
ncbi:MAG: hypothetical protein HRT58_00345 [Crocinitomicaceae bacterium]|nr:hypothetical protein [Flavobacteriales bacterium]NQZ34070.1 hypothetical protein [Crocinitomicaceae bacterium]